MKLAPHPIAREFEADVLAQLKAEDARMHGCPVDRVECDIEGGVAVWFKGLRDGIGWEGALRLSFPWLAQRKWLGDSNAVTDAVLACLQDIGLRTATVPLIQRAVS